jgi:TRAP-type mannitol/chloroaromatic compound transport system substrate-binding protein
MPADLLARARVEAEGLYAEIAARDALSGRIVESYRRARTRTAAWSQANLAHFLPARVG